MRKMIRTLYFGAQQIRFKNLFQYVLAELNIHKTRRKFGTKSVSICLDPSLMHPKNSKNLNAKSRHTTYTQHMLIDCTLQR